MPLVVLLAVALARLAGAAIGQTQDGAAARQQQRPRRVPAQSDTNRPAANEPATARPGGASAPARPGTVEVDEYDLLTVDTKLVPVPF